jgi:hypothetical protein
MGLCHSKELEGPSHTVLVIGKFGRGHAGDDVVATVLKQYWSQHKLYFRHIDTVASAEIRVADLVVVTGELDASLSRKIEQIVLPHTHAPIYGIGVSAAREDIASGCLDMIDRFWCRFREDTKLFQERYGVANASYAPDFSVLSPLPKRKFHKVGERLRVGVALGWGLARGSDGLITQLVSLIRQINSRNDVHWLVIDDGDFENDVQLYNLLPESMRASIPLYRSDAIAQMAGMDLIITSYLHAQVVATLLNISCVSVQHTRDVEEWNRDSGAHAVVVPLDDGRRTTRIPVDEIVRLAATPYAHLRNLNADRTTLEVTLRTLAIARWQKRRDPPYFISRDLIERMHQRFGLVWRAMQQGFTPTAFAARSITLAITGRADHELGEGLAKLFAEPDTTEIQFKAHVEFMLRRHARERQWAHQLETHSDGLFALNKTHQYCPDGWQYILDLLSKCHNPNAPIMDAYIDTTFGKHADMMESVGCIPYVTPWMGFLHSPGHTAGGEPSCADILARESFQKSLAFCQALFVMSADLKVWLQKNGVRVPVHVVHFPMRPDLASFTWKEFESNPRPTVVQVGKWQRDTYAIFRIETKMQKMAIGDYREVRVETSPPASYLQLSNALTEEERKDAPSEEVGIEMAPVDARTCGYDTELAFASEVRRMLSRQWNSVEVVSRLPDEEYSTLLTKNIVFLPLKCATACATLVDCIARNTPVIVPRLPAVEEYLGPDYPLYYATDREAGELMNDRAALCRAYLYLRGMDKTPFRPETFIDNIRKALSGEKQPSTRFNLLCMSLII